MQQVPLPGVRIQGQVGNKVYCYCPFHKKGQEKSASMVVYLDTGKWKCHACTPEKQELLSLLQRMGLSEPEARIRLIQLRQYVVVEKKTTFKPSPCSESLLGQFLGKRPAPLVKAGFSRAILDEMEVGLDEMRFRATYPIRGPDGAFWGIVGGALFKKGTLEYTTHYGYEEKYIAYGPRQGFPYQVNPKRTCWNLHQVRKSQVQEPVVVVEGFKALMWVRMSGWTNVVALGGAGVESTQTELLAGLGGPYLLLLDNDPTGIEATKIVRRDLRRQTSGIYVVKYPRDVRQPDDLTLDEIRQCLSGGRT